MYHFPEGLFTDVRIERTSATTIEYKDYKLVKKKTRREEGAFIRVYDGKRWYYASTSEVHAIQTEINQLASMAKPNAKIDQDPVVSQLEVNIDELNLYKKDKISNIAENDKLALLKTYLPVLQAYPELKTTELSYLDKYTDKSIYSSKGTSVHYDQQFACIVAAYQIVLEGKTPSNGRKPIYESCFAKLKNRGEEFEVEIEKDLAFSASAIPVKAGSYTVILAPVVAGVFAHESFGHKSEADFMLGDAAMAAEWTLGKQVGSSILSIVDQGASEGSGYVPYDDEGSKTRKTWLIKDGVLSGRLHSALTATALNEENTGNARSIGFTYEPIVRMTSTYIDKGSQSIEELFESVKEGIYIEDFIHGSGMSTFTIAPKRAFMIRDGKIAEAVRVAVITGNVMETLYKIDGLSDEVEIINLGTGGCGKMEQFPLSVSFGGPYVRIQEMQVH